MDLLYRNGCHGLPGLSAFNGICWLPSRRVVGGSNFAVYINLTGAYCKFKQNVKSFKH
jgi:hypothetical protein